MNVLVEIDHLPNLDVGTSESILKSMCAVGEGESTRKQTSKQGTGQVHTLFKRHYAAKMFF